MAIRVVGPIIIAWRRRLRENVCGRRRMKVIIDVGRRSTARDARIREMDMYLCVMRSEGRFTG